MSKVRYRGRFAPSPTGPLHFGSLVSALASYLDAKANQGEWLVRIEDIDPPREQAGATECILKALECYGLHWDHSIIYQSSRQTIYQEHIDQLCTQQQAYPCTCSRKELSAYNGQYPGTCRSQRKTPTTPFAIRLKTHPTAIEFVDGIQGKQSFNLEEAGGDFIIKRKDGLFAYQLAVVVDDFLQEITHIIRGSDLLDSTPRQYYLQSVLAFSHPNYAHIPAIIANDGKKLSKQNLADPLPLKQPQPLLLRALHALNQHPLPELSDATVSEILQWATTHWNASAIPQTLTIPEACLPTIVV
ncbi:tRNA glutamyl-Q(34) synthetase GluQRS [Zooshikella harenae]|uniref:Glutamyl-Q tRNA(Asp) synthetase n=1 Tax=Zooshikella harenae TaxID=2827238 RepID=A0ABS5Z618_9GAMM|nr:tRNA glutamyl-Q(34) synthetase GluQRS [Zooshikella harenae]MBU2709450.1 tRNA glutamyl-Q(34) synthetase GluQRS [Zooshikella harenae]